MPLKTKEAVCNWVNEKLKQHQIQNKKKFLKYDSCINLWVSNILRPKKVQVPIYTTKWKLKILRSLQKLFYGPEEMKMEHWCSRIDFSKIIWADQWKKYPFTYEIALPKYTTEHKYCWEISLNHAFFQEDLQFGVRPIHVYKYTVDMGKGPLIVNKNNGKIYALGSGVMLIDCIKDFEHFIMQQHSDLQWDCYEVKSSNFPFYS
ncbi:hypothetical protein [Aureispira anguillae]|uniref:Uncharacterized protein n=1 Tax=Aureispira anguillae TaxID=2864201 RepID=A0A915YED1_9BACT|nr:hypothetical protein [Aureispira anguillae]BDS11573.1 hypothetical protein AsAng_0022870 [Aureispira anguillae]